MYIHGVREGGGTTVQMYVYLWGTTVLGIPFSGLSFISTLTQLLQFLVQWYQTLDKVTLLINKNKNMHNIWTFLYLSHNTFETWGPKLQGAIRGLLIN